MTESPSPVRYEVDGAVATITMDRPDAMNACDDALKVALRDAVQQAAADDAVRAVVLTGTGRAFCVGQDLREHVERLRSASAEGGPGVESVWATVPEHYNPIATALATMPKPVVAAVNGVAAGAGAAFAFAADIRLVARSAGFNLAFAGIGLSCDSGSSWWLPRLVGYTRAAELLLLPRTVRAEEALAIGLATQLVDDEALAATAAELAARLAAGPTLAYASIRRALAFSATHGLEESLAHEAELMALTGSSRDHADAVESFVAKQPPTFHGR